MITIFVAETIPVENKGEAALMHGIVNSIETFADDEVKFYLCSDTKELDEAEYPDNVTVLDDPGLIPSGEGSLRKLRIFSYRAIKHILFLILYKLLGRFSLSIFRGELWKAYHEADAIIVGHDNAFCKFHIPLILFTKALGKRTAIYGCTIMPVVINSKFIKHLANFTLNKVDLITTRENLTYQHLQDIGIIRPPSYCTADKAFILKPASEDRVAELSKTLGLTNLTKPIIGVMVVKGSTVFKAAFKDKNYAPAEKYDRHIEEIAKTLDEVIDKNGATLVFVPHCIGPGDYLDDRICARDVVNKMQNKDKTRIITETLKVTELKGLMSNFDMVVSERTHGGINAASMMIPTLWITHPKDHRTYGIVESTLKLPDCIYNIEDLDHKTLFTKIQETFESREKIKEKLIINIPIAQELTLSNGRYFKEHILNSK